MRGHVIIKKNKNKNTKRESMSDNQVQDILPLNMPIFVYEVQQFLRFDNFDHCFVSSYSAIWAPLTQWTNKDPIWNRTTKS